MNGYLQPITGAVPSTVKIALRRRLGLWRGRRTRLVLERAEARARETPGDGPGGVLGMDDLIALQAMYPKPPPYGYSEAALLARGEERADFLERTARVACGIERGRCLEIGCLDGMVSAVLQRRGWSATAVDRVAKGFDPRAREAGATLLEMSAEGLAFPDDAFDLAFSYDAFEHIGDPAAALGEAIRVTRPGGAIYLNFGPLYNSALGLHAYRQIPVPFCQFLFARETMDAFCRERGLGAIKYEQLNGWPLSRYRALWDEQGDRLQLVHYVETWSERGLELVERHPRCFAGKGLDYEELAVCHIEAIFRVAKRDRGHAG